MQEYTDTHGNSYTLEHSFTGAQVTARKAQLHSDPNDQFWRTESGRLLRAFQMDIARAFGVPKRTFRRVVAK